ncbi:hypothetical protein BHE74_00040830 [Ensete ventricosum]|nr:hypothetical protein BHE74_00040830 [Ensete ventricosum]
MMQMLRFRGGSASTPSSKNTPASPRSGPRSSPNPNPYDAASGCVTPGSLGPARPLRLVYCDDNGKFRMDPEAVAMLQFVKGPIGVVAVCGRARQGKSFVLNQVPLPRFLRFLVESWVVVDIWGVCYLSLYSKTHQGVLPIVY